MRCVTALLAGAFMAGCGGGTLDGNKLDGNKPVGDRQTRSVSPERLEYALAQARSEPVLLPGDSFLFSNPDVTWRVDSVLEDGRIEWSADNGERQVTAANPLLPALSWESPIRGTGRRLITGQSEPLFPLIPGKSISFRATVDTDRPPYAWEFGWTCITEDVRSITVPAGTFEVFPVSCGRTASGELVFQYAPEIGNYVQLIVTSSNGGAPSIRNLISYERATGPRIAKDAMADSATDTEIKSEGMMQEEDGSALAEMANGETGGKTGGGPKVLGLISGVDQTGGGGPTSENTPEMSDQDRSVGSEDGASFVALHLASFQIADNAEKGWRKAIASDGDQLDGLQPIIRKVDIPNRGPFYRLHAGPVASAGRAEEICRILKQRGRYCKTVSVQ